MLLAPSKMRRWQLISIALFLLVDLALGTFILLQRRVAPAEKSSKDQKLLRQAKASGPESDGARVNRWREDIEFFAEKFPSFQVDFAKLYNLEEFHRSLVNLEDEAPQLSDSEIILGLMQVVAAGGVSHNTVDPEGKLEFHPYPLRFFWFSDGPALTEAKKEYGAALGARVVRIGSMAPEQLEEAVSPYLPHENLFWLHELSPEFMLTREVADHFGIAAADGTIEITLARSPADEFKLKVSPVSADSGEGLIHADEALHLPVPLVRKNPGSWYWYEYLPSTKALYIRYDRCQDQKRKSFRAFAREVFRFVDTSLKSHPIDRVIVDLRFNSGGDSSVIEPLLHGLRARSRLSAPGHLYALIGRATYSSGMMAAVELHQDLHAILVGEPAGSKPNEYGEVERFKLPNSGISIAYTTKYFPLLENSDSLVLEPDIPIQPTIADMLDGKDKPLEVALKSRAAMTQ